MRQLKITSKTTPKEGISLDKYFTEMERCELISAEEEAELAQKIKKGDAEALEKLVKANLRFVVSVSKQYLGMKGKFLKLEDLISEGNIGLVKAAERFDETRGFKFISYAVWWIRQSILQLLADHSRIIRLPLSQLGSINKIDNAIRQLEQELCRQPSPEEIAKHLDLDAGEVKLKRQLPTVNTSLDSSFTDEGGNFYDILPDTSLPSPEDTMVDESLKTEILSSLQYLPQRERLILKMYYGLDGHKSHTYSEIEEHLHLGKGRAQSLIKRSVKFLRWGGRSENLKEFLGK